MDTLLPHLQEWFFAKEEHFRIFSESDSRIEGWFKAELLVLFNHLVRQRVIDGFDREANITSPKDGTRKQVDFRIRILGRSNLCELKALCISQAAGTPRNLAFYFRDDNLGLIKDFKKLDDLAQHGKWILAFIYPTPGPLDWCAAIDSLPRTVAHWKPITVPRDTPEFAFISLWKG